MAAREAANRINRDNSLTGQAKAAVGAVSRNNRVARINPDRTLRSDEAAVNKPVILTDKTAGFGFPKPAALYLIFCSGSPCRLRFRFSPFSFRPSRLV